MLNQIHIRDLATIEELHLHLQQGSTMITGETGAGKSIFIEAIELALGGRASPTIIRSGKEKVNISLCFDISNFPKVIHCLKNLDLYQETPECIIRRVVTSDGRSRCYVNGAPATLQLVKELGELLFHLHSQHEQHVLLKSDVQRDMLDRYADELVLAAKVKELAEQIKSIELQINRLQEKKLESSARSNYLHFQLEELNSIQLQPGEWDLLEAEHHRLTHAEELIHSIQHITQSINGEERNIQVILNDIRKMLEAMQTVEPKAATWINNVNSAVIQIDDLESELENYLENIAIDPEKLQDLEKRISQIFNLCRKHKLKPQELLQFKQQLQDELLTIDGTDDNLMQLEIKKKEIEAYYQEAAEKLSQKRQKAALSFAKEITQTMQSLSLPYCLFKVELEKEANAFSLHGKEKIVFLIKTNPEQSLQPLHKDKTISGGELSRLSLAVHLALAHRTSIPTLVFDEVDTGLSGATAEKIGKLLRKLGESYQVFCVTHQPQVAALGHHHILVEKEFTATSAYTRLKMLNLDEKTREIARMLGGEKITKKTLEHAKEVLLGV